MKTLKGLNNERMLEVVGDKSYTDLIDESFLKEVLSIPDDFTRQSAIMLMTETAKRSGQVRNFQKLIAIVKQKIVQDTLSTSHSFKFPEFPMVLNTGEWLVDKDGVRRTMQKGQAIVSEVASWQPIIITNVFLNQETNTYKIQLAFRESDFSSVRTITVNKSMVANSGNIVQLSDLGIAVNSHNASALVKYLSDLEQLNVDIIPKTVAVSRMGWVDGMEFVPYTNEISFDGEVSYAELFGAISEGGDYQKWKDAVIAEDNIYSKVVLGASFASPLVGLLGSLTFFVHLWGNTGNGKTVALHLAESVWGNPTKLVQNLNGTAVALERLSAFFCNMPLCLDELQTLKKFGAYSKEGGFDDILYRLSQGRGKSRGRKDGSIDPPQSWAMAIVTTGEEPITSDKSGGGAKNRVLDVYCQSRLFNDAIKLVRTVNNNYGYAGKEYIIKLQKYVKEFGVDRIQTLYNKFFDRIMKSGPTEKQALAATMVTLGYTLMEMFIFNKTELNAVELGNELLDKLQPMLIGSDEINNIESFYEDVVSFVVQNKHHFIHTSNAHGIEYNPIENRMEIWGRIKDDYMYVVYNVFRKFCNDQNINYKKALKSLIEGDKIEPTVLQSGTIESTKTVRIDGRSIRAVAFKVGENPQVIEIDIPADELPF